MTTSNVAAALRELVAADYVVRRKSTADRRRVTVSLTNSGARMVATHRAVRVGTLRERVEATLTPGEQRQLVAVVPVLVKLTAGPVPAVGS